MGTIGDILNAWVNARKADIISAYKNKGLKASGAFEQGLRVETKENESSLIDGKGHSFFMVNGRGVTNASGNGVLRSSIRQWIDDKGITPKDNISKDSLAFLITRKIHRDGIKVPNNFNDGRLLTDTLTQAKYQELYNSIAHSKVLELKSDIQNTWQQ